MCIGLGIENIAISGAVA